MNRRSYLTGISAVVATISGCIGESKRNGSTQNSDSRIEVVDSRHVATTIVSQSANPPKYTATVVNNGINGECLIELRWPTDANQSSELATSTTISIESEERRSITLTADRPSSVNRFGFQTKSKDFAADIKNNGEDTAVKAHLAKEPSGTILETKERPIPSGETITVQFHVPEGYAGEYAIRTVLAEV